jgi:crossover junction endodeoxyribonuclease RuvC
MIFFLGIDPGLNKTGVGVVGWNGGKLSYVSHALVKSNAKASFVERLASIIAGVQAELGKYDLHSAAVEDVFYSVNAKSALVLGQTRGAILATLISAKLSICEFSALQIKQSVVGYGKAEKEQVRKMVELHLQIELAKHVPLDVSDALACAICLALHQTSRIR